MITAAIINREEFVTWVSGRGVEHPVLLDPHHLKTKVRKNQYAIVWENDDLFRQSGNPIILVPRTELRDFFAFVTTYVTEYVPFTAFFRVLALEEFDRQLDASELENHPTSINERLIGIGITEAFLRLDRRVISVNDIPLTAVGGTLSTVLASSLYRGADHDDLDEVARRWVRTYKLLGNGETPSQAIVALDIFHILSSAFNQADKSKSYGTPPLLEALRNVARSGAITAEDWQLLTRGRSELIDLFPSMRGPREDRIRSYNSAIESLHNPRTGDEAASTACILGCLLALAGEGSFQFLPLSRDFSPHFPGGALWFGVWASLFKSTDVLTIGGCLGRRAARDFLSQRRIFDNPTDDLAFYELDVIGSVSGKEMRSSLQGVLSLEIMPGVSGKFKTSKNNALSENETTRNLSAKEYAELRFLVDRIAGVTDRLGLTLGLESSQEYRGSRSKRK